MLDLRVADRLTYNVTVGVKMVAWGVFHCLSWASRAARQHRAPL